MSADYLQQRDLIELLRYSRTPTDFLLSLIEEKKKRNPSFSIRALSARLGYKNPSLLNDVLKGRRSFSNDLLVRIAKYEKMEPLVKEYLENLILINKSIGEKKSKYEEENQKIAEFWGIGFKAESMEPHELLIVNFIEKLGTVSEEELSKKLKVKVFSAVIERNVKSLIKKKMLIREGDKLRASSDKNRKFVMDHEAYKNFLPTLSSAFDQGGDTNKSSFVVVPLNDQEFNKAREHLYSAIEKILIMASESEPLGSASDERKMRTLFMSLFTAEK